MKLKDKALMQTHANRHSICMAMACGLTGNPDMALKISKKLPTSSTNGKAIMLKDFAEGKVDAATLNRMFDELLHEILHNVCNSFDISATSEESKNKVLFDIFNGIEDARIELAGAKMYIGYKTSMRRLQAHEWSEIPPNETRFNLAKALYWVLTNQKPIEFFSGETRELLEIVRKLIEPWIEKINERNANGAFSLSKSVYELLKAEKEDLDKQQEDDGESQGQDGEGEDQDDGESQGQGQSQGQDGEGEDQDDGESQGQGQGQGQDGEDQDDGESQGQGQDGEGEDQDDGESQGQGQGGEGQQSPTPSTGNPKHDALNSFFAKPDEASYESSEMFAECEPEEIDELFVNLQDAYIEVIEEANGGGSLSHDSTGRIRMKDQFNGHAVPTIPAYLADTSNDIFHDFCGKGDIHSLLDDMASVRPAVDAITAQASEAFFTQVESQERYGLEEGDLTGSDLWRVATGDYKVFEQLNRPERHPAAVTLIIDQSGSMSGSPIATAKKAALAFSIALKEMGVSHEISGFTTGGGSSPSGGGATSRGTLELALYKSFEGDSCIGLSKMSEVGMSCNIDGESIRILSQSLIDLDVEKKICIVFSDGHPAGALDQDSLQRDLLYSVSHLEENGIDVVGIGIESEAVKHYYPDHVVINDMADLTGATLTKLSEMLID